MRLTTGSRSVIFCLIQYHLRPNCMHASKYSDETAGPQARMSVHYSHMRLVPKFHKLVHTDG